MTYNDVQLDVIDQRVRAAVGREKATATMVSRDPDSNNGTALFDGSTVATPVKVQPHTWARTNDRVTLDRYGSDWVVTGTFGTGMPNEDTEPFAWSGNTTSATNVTITGAAGITFVKERGSSFTRLWVSLNGSLVATAANTVAVLGVRILGTDYDVVTVTMNSGSVQQQFYGRRDINPMAAGAFEVVPVWRMTSGAGPVIAAGTLQMHVRESSHPLSS